MTDPHSPSWIVQPANSAVVPDAVFSPAPRTPATPMRLPKSPMPVPAPTDRERGTCEADDTESVGGGAASARQCSPEKICGSSLRQLRDRGNRHMTTTRDALPGNSDPGQGSGSQRAHGVSGSGLGEPLSHLSFGNLNASSARHHAESRSARRPLELPRQNWKKSLGGWDELGGTFICPESPCEAWGLPGCGMVSRPRAVKCEECHRVIRVDWNVG